MKRIILVTLILGLGVFPRLGISEENSQKAVSYLQKEWAIGNYQLEGDLQETAFVKLMDTADQFVKQYPSDAGIFIWRGIISSTYAGVKGGIGALKYAKASKADLEKALELNPDALNGSAYTSLGTLYFKVPGWPIGFGDDDKAQELLKKALTINPAGIDSNYFYADYLISEKEYRKAKEYLQNALNAPPRPGREIADQGRQKEIRKALAEVNKRL